MRLDFTIIRMWYPRFKRGGLVVTEGEVGEIVRGMSMPSLLTLELVMVILVLLLLLIVAESSRRKGCFDYLFCSHLRHLPMTYSCSF